MPLQRATTLRDINATGVEASSASPSTPSYTHTQPQPYQQRQAQYTHSMPPEAFDDEDEADELAGLVIDQDFELEGVHAATPPAADVTSSVPRDPTATTGAASGASGAVHTHLQPTVQLPASVNQNGQGQGPRQSRAVSEPPISAMHLDSDPPYPYAVSGSGSGGGGGGDVEMRIHSEEEDDSTLSTWTAGLVPSLRTSSRGAAFRPAPRTANHANNANHARPLGRWHTDFVIRIRMPGDGEDKGGPRVKWGGDVGERLALGGSGIGEDGGEDERIAHHRLALLSEDEPDIELPQPVYTSYSYPNTSGDGDGDEIDESQTSNPFLRSPSASPSSPLLAPEPDMASTEAANLVPTLSIPASSTITTTMPTTQTNQTPTSTTAQHPAPPSPAPTEIEFPESQDITVDIQRRGVRIRDFAYAMPYVVGIIKGETAKEEKGTEPNTPAASFYHGGGPSPTNFAQRGFSVSASFSSSCSPSPSSSSFPSPSASSSSSVYPLYRTPEIFDQYKAMTEVDYRWTQPVRTFPIAGRSLRRLLDMGWVSEGEVKARASEDDLEELRVFDERRRMDWERRVGGDNEVGRGEMGEGGEDGEVDDRERFRREMRLFPWRWIRKGKWVKLAGGIDRDDDEEEEEEGEEEAPLPPLPTTMSAPTTSSVSSTSKPLPALPLPPLPPPKPVSLAPPPFEPGTIPPLSTSTLADLIAYDPPPTLLSSLPPFPPAPRPELRAIWVDIKRGYWKQVDRMWVVSRERELRRRREMEEAGRKVKENEEREREKAKRMGSARRGCSPGKRRIEGEEDDMDVREDSGGSLVQEQGQGGVKRRRLSPLGDENVPPSSASGVVMPISVVSAQRGARPSASSSVLRTGNPHIQVHPARVVSSSSNYHPTQSSSTAFSSNLNPGYPSTQTSSTYSTANLIPPEKQYPAPAAAYNPRLYPDARSAKRAQAGVIGMDMLRNGKTEKKGKQREGGPLGGGGTPMERQDTPILDDEGDGSGLAQGAHPGPSDLTYGSQQAQTSQRGGGEGGGEGEVRVSSAHQGQRLVHPKKGLGGLGRQKSFNEL